MSPLSGLQFDSGEHLFGVEREIALHNPVVIARVSLDDFYEATALVLPEVDEKVIKSFANIPGVKTGLVNTLNVIDLLNFDKLILTQAALKKLEEVYA